jgi:hypothetical protein
VSAQANGPRLLPWILRGILVLLALAAPIVTYRAFTDPDTPDPQREERLREVNQPNRPVPGRGNNTRPDPYNEARP